ncbi:MAG: hypothetical protein H7833_03720 [Magnetococcus sp. DMHC-1]|nr:hypothetical protein [Magnetococcales bacterium]
MPASNDTILNLIRQFRKQTGIQPIPLSERESRLPIGAIGSAFGKSSPEKASLSPADVPPEKPAPSITARPSPKTNPVQIPGNTPRMRQLDAYKRRLGH